MLKKMVIFFILVFFLAPSVFAQAAKTVTYTALPKAGEKYYIGNEFYFTYQFDQKPKMGTSILKIEVFTKDGKKDTSLRIKGNTGMPSMRGAHDSEPVAFQLNKAGIYLMPVNIVMPGAWEVKLDFYNADKNIFSGSVRFSV